MRRQGVSLFQLLIVLALLIILFGLLFPALLKVREAAARSQSQNNLRQLGLGMHNYHSTMNFFPSGNDKNNFSALAQVLPYIEQNALFQGLDMKKPSDDKANATVRKTVIKVYLSPRDPLPFDGLDSGPTNYVLNAGTKYGLDKNDGAFFQDSQLKIQTITDGSSNTVMGMETLRGDGGKKAVDVRRQHVQLGKDALKELKDEAGVDDFKNNRNIAGDRCGSWLDGRFLQATFNGARRLNDVRPDVDCGGLGGLSSIRCLDKIALVGFCDGSVRTISISVAETTWKAILTRDGGEVVNDF